MIKSNKLTLFIGFFYIYINSKYEHIVTVYVNATLYNGINVCGNRIISVCAENISERMILAYDIEVERRIF